MARDKVAFDSDALERMQRSRRVRLDTHKCGFGYPIDIYVMCEPGMMERAVLGKNFIIPRARRFPSMHPDVMATMMHVDVVELNNLLALAAAARETIARCALKFQVLKQ